MRSARIVAFLVLVVGTGAGAGCGSSPGNGGASGGSGGTGTGTGGGTGGTTATGGQAGATTGGAGGHAGGGAAGAAGGHAGAAGGANGTDCNPPCASGSACVGTGTQGGVFISPDGGACPTGRHLEGNGCIQDLSYQGVLIPGNCVGVVSCSCAAATLCTGQHTCLPAGGNEIRCVQLVP
jgi:hypothetical protein